MTAVQIKKKLALLLAYVVIAVFCVLEMLPLYWVVITSFKPNLEIFGGHPLLPAFAKATLDHYAYVFKETGTSGVAVASYLKNSLIVTTCTIVITMVVGTLAAYGLARFRMRGRSLLAVLFLIVRMVPAMAVGIPVYHMVRSLELLNTHFALILVYSAFLTPFVIWMMRGFLLDIPAELEDSARIDGCNRLQAFWHVTVPMAAPGLMATAIFTFLGAWNEYIFASLLTSTPDAQTTTVLIAGQVSFDQVYWGRIAAIATVLIVPAVIFIRFMQRYLIQGLTMGAVKE
ncbi:carbohydrate ABC transporter permease [bacterium]|jgi:multiple sugar transport system permease protein|nr:carbohydrate ABC transporter permease [bacterium]